MTGLPFPDIDPIALQLGPFAVRWYGLAYLAGFLLGWRYCLLLVQQAGGVPTRQDIDDYVMWAVLGVVLGGRLGSVLFYNLDYYLANPLEILMVWKGGMAFHGGFLGVVVATWLFAQRRKIPPLRLGDAVAPVVPIGLFFGRLANFANAELYGRAAVDVPWAMVFPTDPLAIPRHPSQLYEAALEGVILFGILALLARSPGIRAHHGILTGIFLAGYGLTRSIAEFFREPDAHIGFLAGGVTMGQILSVPMIVVGLGIVAWAIKRGPRTA